VHAVFVLRGYLSRGHNNKPVRPEAAVGACHVQIGEGVIDALTRQA